MSELENWILENSEVNRLLERREKLMRDIHILRTRPPYTMKVGDYELIDTEELNLVLLDHKFNQVKHIDKTLNIKYG